VGQACLPRPASGCGWALPTRNQGTTGAIGVTRAQLRLVLGVK